MATPAPEELYYAVQRGDNVFQCLGSDLKDKLEDGDVMAVHRPSTGVTHGWKVEDNLLPWEKPNTITLHVLAGDVNFPKGEIYKEDGTFIQTAGYVNNSAMPVVCVINTDTDGTSLINAFSGNTAGGRDMEFGPLTNTTLCTSMDNMFSLLTGRGPIGGLEYFDTSNVTSFQGMFRNTELSGSTVADGFKDWDVSSASILYEMFGGSLLGPEFNNSFTNWNVTNCIAFNQMFAGCSFNPDVTLWNTESAITIRGIFNVIYKGTEAQVDGTPAFNRDISNWNVSNLKSEDIGQPVPTNGMGSAFLGQTLFDQDLSSWCSPELDEIPYTTFAGTAMEGNLAKYPKVTAGCIVVEGPTP